MSDYLSKPPVINLNAFANDFAVYMAELYGRKTPTVELTVVPDDEWDQLLAITNPYRTDRDNRDERIGISYVLKERMTEKEVPDLLKTLYPQLADAMQTADIIVTLNEQTLTHPEETSPERALNAMMTHLIVLTEKALALLGYTNLKPLADVEDFAESPYFRMDKYIVSGR
jgi:hypothetical protein